MGKSLPRGKGFRDGAAKRINVRWEISYEIVKNFDNVAKVEIEKEIE